MNQTISILGCGWLGLPLAKSLVESGCRVRGSTTTENKISILQEAGIEPFLLKCLPKFSGDRLEMFFKSETLVITLPFRRDFKDPKVYLEQIRSIITQAVRSSVRFVIFTSSTSVYSNNGTVVEKDQVLPDNPRSRTLFEAEALLKDNRHFDTTIIRFAGMYDSGERKLGRSLSSRRELESGPHPVNLIHRDDCVLILEEIIRKNVRNEIFNACSDGHPARKDLYSKIALKRGFPPPVFKTEYSPEGKIVSNDKLKTRLDYRFRHPDPIICVERCDE